MTPDRSLKILCVFGRHQYGDPARGISTEYAAFIPALKRLGHEVIHFESWDRTLYDGFADLNRTLLRTVIHERPDILLTVQMNYEIWIETLELIQKKEDVATISWTTDDSWKYREVSRFIGGAYDAMTTTYRNVVAQYHRDGISNVMLTQWAANSSTMTPPLPAAYCRYPVTFVGAAHGSRRRWIRRLRRAGIAVDCFGHGWPQGSVAAESIPQIMRDSVISLNFSNSRRGHQIKARNFEVPGAGGFLLTEYAEDLGRWYRIGEEIDVFQTLRELVAKIRYYLYHPEKRDAMAISGFRRTQEYHTYEHRLASVISHALKSKKESAGKGRGGTDQSQEVELLSQAMEAHRMNRGLLQLKRALVLTCSAVWGKKRGIRAARRLVFELSWRLSGRKTFTASGLPGRMFPEL
jgi:spore maturation protein CgeB